MRWLHNVECVGKVAPSSEYEYIKRWSLPPAGLRGSRLLVVVPFGGEYGSELESGGLSGYRLKQKVEKPALIN